MHDHRARGLVAPARRRRRHPVVKREEPHDTRSHRPRTLTALLCLVGAASAGHLLLSANDGNTPNVDGVYKVADPMAAHTLTILDVRSFPPARWRDRDQPQRHRPAVRRGADAGREARARVVPDEVRPERQDQALSPTTSSRSSTWGAHRPRSSPGSRCRAAVRPLGERAGTLAFVAHPDDGALSLLTISGKTVALGSNVKVGDAKSLVSHAGGQPRRPMGAGHQARRGQGRRADARRRDARVRKQDIAVGSRPYGLDISRDGRIAAVANVAPAWTWIR